MLTVRGKAATRKLGFTEIQNKALTRWVFKHFTEQKLH